MNFIILFNICQTTEYGIRYYRVRHTLLPSTAYGSRLKKAILDRCHADFPTLPKSYKNL